MIEIEEEEYTSNLTAPVFKRIVGLMKPHMNWVIGFFITIALTSAGDAYFTYLNKEIVDTGISLKQPGGGDAHCYDLRSLILCPGRDGV